MSRVMFGGGGGVGVLLLLALLGTGMNLWPIECHHHQHSPPAVAGAMAGYELNAPLYTPHAALHDNGGGSGNDNENDEDAVVSTTTTTKTARDRKARGDSGERGGGGSGEHGGGGSGERGGGGSGGGGGHHDGSGHRQRLRDGGGGGGGAHGHGHAHRKRNRRPSHHHQRDNDLSLWINEQQLAKLSGDPYERIYAIERGHVLAEIRDTSIYKYLTIPAEVNHVNFTWKSGKRKFFYHFDQLHSDDDAILKAPIVSIKTKGRIPQEEKDFSIFLPCSNNTSGIAMFNIGLSIENRRGKALPGTPLRLSFKKECAHRAPDPECQRKCGSNGYCNHNNICQCKAGYTGPYCQTAFCFPACLNGGNCTAPSVCTCPDGYQGTQCEGGICSSRCLNGGKCVQKDMCKCSTGYYGLHCEYSKCVIPCKNNGRCIGTNICRCHNGLRGNHCEIGRKQQQRSTCKRPCRHGTCMANKRCKCDDGYYGRFCNGKVKKHRKAYSH